MNPELQNAVRRLIDAGCYYRLDALATCYSRPPKASTVLRRFAVQPRTVFSGAPCLKLSVDGYTRTPATLYV